MSNEEFLKEYGDDIRITAFARDVFLTRSDTEINIVQKHRDEILRFYTPRYHKNDEYVDDFSGSLMNPQVKPLKVIDALDDLAKWDLVIDTVPPINQLRPIPIVTDRVSGKTLILDGNHMVCGLLSGTQFEGPVTFVEITMDYVESVFFDFIIIKR